MSDVVSDFGDDSGKGLYGQAGRRSTIFLEEYQWEIVDGIRVY